jgi:hypothetical protein
LRSYTVRKYQPEDYQLWNNFVASAKNATFLFHRDFMEYHQERFDDFSLLIFDDKGTVKAILPANRVGDTIFSHEGLTYGGLLLSYCTKLPEVVAVFKEVLLFLNNNKVLKLNLKNIPTIFSTFPNDELDYLMFILKAERTRSDTLSVIDFNTPFKISSTRKQEIKKAIGFVVKEVVEFEAFWNQVLIPNLEEKHKAQPVHSLLEINSLHSNFPKQIRQFNVYLNDVIVAGTTIFESETVAHSQYISGLSKYNHLGGLDILYHHLIKNVFSHKKYFDFGISNENQGKNINQGLLFWKESFGARTIVQNFYTIETKNYINLENVFL